MKSNFLVLVLFYHTILLGQGTEVPRGQIDQQRLIDQWAEDLGLDEGVKIEFSKVLNTSMDARKKLRNDNLSREEIRNKLLEISRRENEAIKTFLKKSQYDAFIRKKEELREQRRQRMRQRQRDFE